MQPKILIVCLLTILATVSCNESYTPRPRGYFRIDFPEKRYQPLQEGFPYSFEIPVYASAVRDTSPLAEADWMNLQFPSNKAELHISYKTVNNNLFIFTEESRDLTYKHTQKASSIEERLFLNPDRKVYGTIYLISGNAASPVQFYLTDSVRHFLRGALYIRDVPNVDSLKPVIDFLLPDVYHLIETTSWHDAGDN